MSRRLDRPYMGPGYACERCGVQVYRRKRYDRSNLCTECAVVVVENTARFFAKYGGKLYRDALKANGAT